MIIITLCEAPGGVIWDISRGACPVGNSAGLSPVIFMLVIESNSQQFPTEPWTKGDDTVITIKWPTKNTDILAGRHISSRRNGPEYPFLCYKWNPPLSEKKWSHIPRDNIEMADWEHWDEFYRSFGPVKHPDPSSGACAVYSVVECYNPPEIGLIGFDYVLDNNTDWMHDAKAELASIKSIVDIVDLRSGTGA